MPNRLKDESSPYLLQHADNPVDWRPWGPEALEEAARADKPIFLSIGYAACHWCHVMAHESFEDPETAAIMNQHFINVKVDREERPDVDALYMDAVVAMTGHGGWPLSAFLTPEGRPFYGGTYFPPVRRHQLPSFRELLLAIARAWQEDRERLVSNAGHLTAQLQEQPILVPSPAGEIEAGALEAAAENLLRGHDARLGGWGGAPKFPQPMAIEFLLRRYERSGDKLARDMAARTLRAMARGGIYDQLGGGFHRYAVDAAWRVPHFEKMLYDNAQLSLVYLHAWLLLREPSFLRVAQESLDFLSREMRHPEGGFFSSLDADSEGAEGKFYVWTEAEFEAAVADPAAREIARAAYGVTPQGNFEGKTVLHRSLDDDELSRRFGPPEEWQPPLDQARRALFERRAERVRPAADDKVITAWNGLALTAFAEAARTTGESRHLEAARSLAGFLLDSLRVEGRLMRTWRQGRARVPAYLEDHASLGLGLLALYQVDFNPKWYREAMALADEILRHFPDEKGGFFDTRDDHEPLIVRPKSVQDSPTPSGNTLAAKLFLQIAALEGEDRFRQPAETMLKAMQTNAVRHPTAFAGWLCALDFALGPQAQLALVGNPADSRFAALAQAAWETYRPWLVTAGGLPGEDGAPALLAGRPAADGPTAYLCRDFSCRLPTTQPDELRRQLAEIV